MEIGMKSPRCPLQLNMYLKYNVIFEDGQNSFGILCQRNVSNAIIFPLSTKGNYPWFIVARFTPWLFA